MTLITRIDSQNIFQNEDNQQTETEKPQKNDKPKQIDPLDKIWKEFSKHQPKQSCLLSLNGSEQFYQSFQAQSSKL